LKGVLQINSYTGITLGHINIG